MRAMLVLMSVVMATPAFAVPAEQDDATTMAAQMAAGLISSEGITRAALARIAAMDRKGPTLRAVIAVNPDALTQARAADARRRARA